MNGMWNFRLGAGTAIAIMLAAATPVHAATLISELFVSGQGAATVVANSSDAGFTGRSNKRLSLAGANITTALDLASGSLRGRIDTLGSTSGGTFNLSLTDQFQFNIVGADAATVTRLGLRVYFSGAMAVTGRTEVRLGNRIFGALTSAGSDVVLNSGDFQPFSASGNGFSFPDLPVTRGGLGEIAGTFDHILYFDVRGVAPEIVLATNVQAFTASRSLLDFGNSAHIGFVLPSGVTFTSGSGLALTQSAFPSAVPEPASWAMLIAGFGLVGAVQRRRRAVPG
ncbi:MAG: hypothetical protein RL490_1095 [Pseudomonadota bacterium]|jgi:hypothetical protein